MKFFIYLLILACMAGCNRKDDAPAPAEGIIFSPLAQYQEAYPGQIITFKFRAATTEPITGFHLRFKLPGSETYVALPEYPDVQQDAGAFAGFQSFEYSLPPSATDTDAEIRIKFTATTASRSYEEEYVVKMLSHGLQNIKVYSPEAATYFNFSALDLVNGNGVTGDAPATSQDLVGVTTESYFPLQDATFSVLNGWTSGNSTRFKLTTAAKYSQEPSTYEATYTAIAPAQELTGAMMTGSQPGSGIGILSPNQYYIAKAERDGATHYIGLAVKRVAAPVINMVSNAPVLDLANEYIQLEIKK